MRFSTRPTTFEDQSAIDVLLRLSKLAQMDATSQFGDHYSVASSDDGTLVGVAGIEVYGTVGLLRSVAVDEHWRSKGIGRQLIAERLEWAAAKGITDLFLLTTDAAEYWTRYGFERINRSDAPPAVRQTSQWSGGCSATAIPMCLKLDL